MIDYIAGMKRDDKQSMRQAGRAAEKAHKKRPFTKKRSFDGKHKSNLKNDGSKVDGPVLLYGLHTVAAALENPARRKSALWLTRNARERLTGLLDSTSLEEHTHNGLVIHDALPRQLDQMTARIAGQDAVHQGAVLEAMPLDQMELEDLGQARLVLVLDQVTDPHNVGAIMRSCVAMGADALITTARHSPGETGVLAKSASGALDMINHIVVRNLSQTLETLNSLRFQTIGLDSEGPDILENSVTSERVALVMGAEGKGLREKTRATCATLARIDMPGPIKSLNVSNAAALGLYMLHQRLG